MNENRKLKIVLAILAVIVVFSIALAVIESNNQKKQLEKFDEYFASTTEKLIYFGRNDCYYCQLLEPAKEAVLDENNIDYYYVDTNAISSSVLDKMLDKLGITNFGTPTLAVVKDSDVVVIQSGVFSTDTDNIKELAEFLNANNVADLTDFITNYESSEESE